MITAFERFQRMIPVAIIFAVPYFLCVLPADAREWNLGGKRGFVEAELVDFDGQQIALRPKKGDVIVVPVSELTKADRIYVKELVELQATFQQQQIQQQQLNQQRLDSLSRFYDVWAIELIAPNGERMVRQYLARDNLHALRLAAQEFPQARTGYSRKIRRRDFSW